MIPIDIWIVWDFPIGVALGLAIGVTVMRLRRIRQEERVRAWQEQRLGEWYETQRKEGEP